jgi:hypothetical protein
MATLPLTASSTARASTTALWFGVPWFVWVSALSIFCAAFGLHYDLTWHRSIGRDGFWNPAHVVLYLSGVFSAIYCAYLIIATTWGHNSDLRSHSVTIWGLRAPIGVFVAAWGGLSMLYDASFDNWWHNAYGLDVKIVSPPHALLILGLRGISTGVMFLILAAMNRAAEDDEATFKRLQMLLVYVGGLAIVGQMFFVQEYTWDIVLHQATAYIAMGIAVPVLLAAFSQASRFRWAATTTAGIYMLILIAEILILPLFPAQPKLGPVFNPVTHLVPGKFPILIIVPALALDLLWQRTKHWNPWKVAIVSGVLFIAVLFAVEWPFANFLMSKASANRFFGTIYFDYNSRPLGFDRGRRFFQPESGWPLYKGLMWASVYAMISTWIGLAFGRWMRGVQR